VIRPDPSRTTSRRLAQRLLPAVAAAVVLGAPADAAAGAELVAEAAFLADTLPPDSRGLALSQTGTDPAPRVQLAFPLGERLGLVGEVGVHHLDHRLAVDTPSASLKILLREPGEDRTGLSLSLDLLGSAHRLDRTETGAGLGAVRGLGPLTARAAAWFASGVASWSPHGHLGTSLAVEVRGVRLLGEVVADVGGGPAALSAGPTLKLPLGDGASLALGALAPVAGAASTSYFVQLSRGL
jgi:hypothetical protein